jgi:hypothetical protein
MRESKIEKDSLVRSIKELKGIAYKFTSPGLRGVPDRLILLPIPKEHRELISKYMYFVECKAPGKKPRPDQLREHKRIRNLGYRVDIKDAI